MTPAEHRAEAERLLAEAEKTPEWRLTPEAHRLLLTAQVHATLACAPGEAMADWQRLHDEKAIEARHFEDRLREAKAEIRNLEEAAYDAQKDDRD